jgi:hypothetical protein
MPDIIETTDALPNYQFGTKDAIDEGMKVFERKQAIRAKKKKWKWVKETKKSRKNAR